MPSICGFRVPDIMITHVKYQERIVNSNVSNEIKKYRQQKNEKKTFTLPSPTVDFGYRSVQIKFWSVFFICPFMIYEKNLCTLRKELEAEEGVDEDEDQANQLQ